MEYCFVLNSFRQPIGDITGPVHSFDYLLHYCQKIDRNIESDQLLF